MSEQQITLDGPQTDARPKKGRAKPSGEQPAADVGITPAATEPVAAATPAPPPEAAATLGRCGRCTTELERHPQRLGWLHCPQCNWAGRSLAGIKAAMRRGRAVTNRSAR